MRVIRKKCLICKKSFKTKWNHQKFCCPQHRNKHNYKKIKKTENYKRYKIKYYKKTKHSLKHYYKNKPKVLAYQIARIEKMRKTSKKFQKKYNTRHLSAQKISLKKWFCFYCFTKKDLQRHHFDYSNADCILIFCRTHHKDFHELNHTRESK